MPLLWIGSWALAELGERLGRAGRLRWRRLCHFTWLHEEHTGLVAVVVSKYSNYKAIVVKVDVYAPKSLGKVWGVLRHQEEQREGVVDLVERV